MRRRGFLGALLGTAAVTAGVAAAPEIVKAAPKPSLGANKYHVSGAKNFHVYDGSMWINRGSTPPSHPAIGQMFLNSSDADNIVINVYTGSDWVRMDGAA